MARSMVTSRIWSNARPLGRIGRFLDWSGYQPLNLSKDAEQQRSLGGKPVFSYIVKTRRGGTPGAGLFRNGDHGKAIAAFIGISGNAVGAQPGHLPPAGGAVSGDRRAGGLARHLQNARHA